MGRNLTFLFQFHLHIISYFACFENSPTNNNILYFPFLYLYVPIFFGSVYIHRFAMLVAWLPACLSVLSECVVLWGIEQYVQPERQWVEWAHWLAGWLASKWVSERVNCGALVAVWAKNTGLATAIKGCRN